MKLSEYIEQLKDFMDTYGDMDTFYSSDDEGNSYQAVTWTGSLYYLPDDQKDEWHPELVAFDDEEYVEQLKEEGCKLIPVCLVN